MKKTAIVLSCLLILLTGLIYVALQGRQKNGNEDADFSGEWTAKESISMGGNIVCCYDPGDRMLAKTMTVKQQADVVTIEAFSSFAKEPPVKGREELSLDGKESEMNYSSEKGGKKSTASLSADGKTLTVNSVVQLMVAKPYHVEDREQLIVYITEVWQLSKDGETLSVQSRAKSNKFGKERSWKTVFEKTI